MQQNQYIVWQTEHTIHFNLIFGKNVCLLFHSRLRHTTLCSALHSVTNSVLLLKFNWLLISSEKKIFKKILFFSQLIYFSLNSQNNHSFQPFFQLFFQIFFWIFFSTLFSGLRQLSDKKLFSSYISGESRTEIHLFFP